MGFTGSTGSFTQYEEIQQLSLTSITASLWTDTAADGNWNTANDWYGTPSGVVPLAGADVLLNNAYAGASQSTINVGSNQVIRSLQIDAPFSYTLNGGSFEFNNEGNAGTSGIIVTQANGTAAHTVNSDLQADNAIVVENNSSSALTLGGNLATQTFPVNFNGSGVVNESGVVSGSGSVYETGTGTTNFSNANTYTGGTFISSGTVNANNGAALGTGTVALSGGTLGSTNGSSIANAIALSGNASLSGITASGLLTQTGGSYTLNLANTTLAGVALSGTNTGQTLTTEVDGGTSTISGVIGNGGTGAGGLTKTGAGTLVLGAANTYTGTTTVSAGTLQLGANNAISSGSNLTLNNSTLNLGSYSDTVGNLSFTNGTINFSGVNQYLVVSNVTAGAGVLTINGWTSGTSFLGTTTNPNVTPIGPSILSDIYFAGSGSGASQQLTTTTSGGATFYQIVPNTTFNIWYGGAATSAAGAQFGNSATNWGGGVPSTLGTSTQKLEFSNAGSTGNANYLSPTMDANYAANAILLSGTAGSYTLNQFDPVTSTSYALTLQGNVPSIIDQSANAQLITGGALAFTANGVIDVSANGSLTIASTLSGAGSITKLSPGTLLLSGNNSGYSGAIDVQAGTLSVSGSNSVLGTAGTTVSSGATLAITDGRTLTNALNLNGAGAGGSGALNANPGASNTATLSGAVTLAGNSTINAGLGTLILGGGISGSGNSLTLTGAGNTTISSAISTGTGGLTLNGTGATILSADNTYTGATTVNSGTLQLSAPSTTGYTVNGSLTVNGGSVTVSDSASTVHQLNPGTNLSLNAGTLTLTGSSTETIQTLSGASGSTLALGSGGYLTDSGTASSSFAGAISGSGTLDKENTGELSLSGSSTGFTGNLIVNDGIVLAGANNATGSATVAVGSSGNFEIQGGVTIASPFSLSTNGASTENGAIENISGSNTISGAVTLTASSTIQSDAGMLTSSGKVALGSYTLTAGGSGNTTYNGVISGTGALAKSGSGTVTLGAQNTYTGATTVSGGTLAIATNNAIGASSSVTLTNGTLALNGYTDQIAGLTFTNGTIDFGTGSNPVALVINSLTATGTSPLLTIANYNYNGGAYGTTTTFLAVASGGSTPAAATLADIYFAGSGSGTAVSGATTLAEGSITAGGSTFSNVTLIVPNTSFLTWSGSGTNSWGTGGNWVGGTAPVRNTASNQKLDFSNAGTTTNANYSTPTMNGTYYVNALKFDPNATTSYTITQAGNTLNLQGNVPSIIQDSAANQTISGGKINFSSNGVIDTYGAGSLTISSYFSGTGTITKLDSGTLILNGTTASTNSGAWNITGGLVEETATSNEMGSGAITVGSGATFELTGAQNLTNALNLTGSGSSGAGALEFAPGTTGASTMSGAVAIGGSTSINTGANGTLTLSGAISGSIGTLTFSGPGTTILSGANTYSGTTSVTAGTVDLNTVTSGGNYSVAGNLSISGGTVKDGASNELSTNTNLTVTGGTYNMGAYSETVQSLSGSAPGAVAIGGGTLTVSEATSGTSTYSGTLSGTGGFTKAGSGTQNLNGTNSYTGATTVNSGTLGIGSALSSTAITVNGGILQTNASSVLSGSSVVTVATGGTVNLNSTAQTISSFSSTGGALNLGSGASLTLSGGTTDALYSVTGSGTITLNAGATLTLNSSINDSGLNIVLDGGTLKLNSTNDILGSLTVGGAATSVLDFSAASGTPTTNSILSTTGVTVGSGSALSVINWVNASNYFYSLTTPSGATLGAINFTGTYNGRTPGWNSFTSGPDGGHEITPVPEPSTYGAILVAISLVGIVIHRRKLALR